MITGTRQFLKWYAGQRPAAASFRNFIYLVQVNRTATVDLVG
jgi:hypothetical protein